MEIDKAALKEMMIDKEERKALKALFTELLFEDSGMFKKLILEILEENKIIVSDEQAERRKKIEAMIDEDFMKYEEVFKALA
ncbi:MAG TPA: hypothetical protein ENJ95_16825 [Bacteroidetes bacterium]|nr:hypothetical protein [Bacteroidota bacterium]